MKTRLSILALASFALLPALPALAGDYLGKKVAASLGLRYDKPVAGLKTGQKAPATIMNASKLSSHGLTGRNDEKVVLTLTGKHTFSLHHAGSGRTLNFKFDGQGNVTPTN